MDGYLKQSTASQARLIGPFLDDTDFKTAETGLTVNSTDIAVRANGTTLSTKNSGGGTHQVNGMYSLSWDATDTANVGQLAYSVVVAGALPVFGTYVVLEEAVYDALFAASAAGYGTAQTGDSFARLGAPAGASVSADIAAVKTDTAAILVDTGTTLDAALAVVDTNVDTAITDIAAVQADVNDIQARLPAALVSGRMSASVGAMATGVVTADALAADAVTEIQTGLALEASVTAVQADTDDIQTRLPAALSGGLMMATVEGISAATVDSILDEVVDDTLTMRQSLRLANSANAGKVSGAGTVTVRIRDVADTKDRVVATVDADGNRTAITRDVS